MAGLIGTFASKGTKVDVDFNDLTEAGIYKINSNKEDPQPNLPKNAYKYGILLVFRIINDSEERILQIYVSHIPTAVYVRMRNSFNQNPSWVKWINLSSTILG